MTLNDLLQECARNTYNSKLMTRTTEGYVGKGLEYATRFLSGINYALRKVCREKYAPVGQDDVIMSGVAFAISDLTRTCIRVREVKQNNEDRSFFVDAIEDVWVKNVESGSTIQVTYDYLPANMTLVGLDVEVPLHPRIVDPFVLCQFADYQFLSEEGTDYDTARAQVWLGLFNDSFGSIVKPTQQKQVKVVTS